MVRCCGLSLSLVKGKTESTVVKIRYKGKAKNVLPTRTKTSIIYAKENDREKRERRKERERKVIGEI